MKVEDWMSIHLVEGALRAAARLEGYHLKRSFQTAKKTGVVTISFLCESQKAGNKCKYLVRLQSGEDDGEGEDPVLIVTKVVRGHSCDEDVGPPSDEWREVLEAWVGSADLEALGQISLTRISTLKPVVTLGTPYKNSAAKEQAAEEAEQPSDEEVTLASHLIHLSDG